MRSGDPGWPVGAWEETLDEGTRTSTWRQQGEEVSVHRAKPHLEMYHKEVNSKRTCAQYLHAKLLLIQSFIIAKI